MSLKYGTPFVTPGVHFIIKFWHFNCQKVAFQMQKISLLNCQILLVKDVNTSSFFNVDTLFRCVSYVYLFTSHVSINTKLWVGIIQIRAANFQMFRWSLCSVGLIQPGLTLVKGLAAWPLYLIIGVPFQVHVRTPVL